jgi:hypothetical protein
MIRHKDVQKGVYLNIQMFVFETWGRGEGVEIRNLNTGAPAFISSQFSDGQAVNSTMRATEDKLLAPNISGIFNDMNFGMIY